MDSTSLTVEGARDPKGKCPGLQVVEMTEMADDVVAVLEGLEIEVKSWERYKNLDWL